MSSARSWLSSRSLCSAATRLSSSQTYALKTDDSLGGDLKICQPQQRVSRDKVALLVGLAFGCANVQSKLEAPSVALLRCRLLRPSSVREPDRYARHRVLLQLHQQHKPAILRDRFDIRLEIDRQHQARVDRHQNPRSIQRIL